MERLMRRWVASLISSLLILLAPGLPAYAQVAHLTSGEAGVPAVSRVALPGAGSSMSFSPLTTISLAPSLSAIPAAGAPSALVPGVSAAAVPAAVVPRAAVADSVKIEGVSSREAAAAPAATNALRTVTRQASSRSGADVSGLAHGAPNFDASAARAPLEDSAPATRGMFTSLRAALSGAAAPASALKTGAALAAADMGIGETAGPSAEHAAAVPAAPAPSFARRTWNGIAGFAKDLRVMAFGDKKLEPLMTDVRKPRLKAQIILCLDAVSNFGMSFLIGALLDTAALAAKHGFAAEKGHLILLSGALIGASLVYALIERTHALLSAIATTRSAGAYRMKLQDNLVHQPMQFHQEHPSGQLSSVIVKGVGYLTAQTTGTQISIFHYMLLLVFGAGMMLFVNPALSVVTLALVPILAWLAHHYQVRAWKLGEKITDQRKELTRQTEESLAMHATVAAFGTQEFEAQRHAKSVDETAALGVESANLYAAYGLVAGIASSISQQLLYIIGGIGKLAGWGLSFGRVTALMLYAGLVQMGANGISSYHLLYQQAAGSANEASNFIKDEPKQADAPGTPALPAGPGRIHFEKVTFSYPSRKAAPVLTNLDFTIEPGQTVAFVGTTGSGKSTVARLLLRQWEPSSGRITVDGRDVTSVTRKSLLDRMAVVPQTVALFSRSLRENMTYGSENVSE
ncbi:MAG: ABC transporter ATP-binding protein, partial [Elusimicrobiota bacterium]